MKVILVKMALLIADLAEAYPAVGLLTRRATDSVVHHAGVPCEERLTALAFYGFLKNR